MERRDFIKSGCGFCAGLVSVNMLGALLEGCSPAEMIYDTSISEFKISVPVEKLDSKKYLIVRPRGLEYDLLLVKENEETYHALAMQCTHRQQPLVVTSTGLFCNEHGSRFDLQGNVTRDPATQPLRKFKTELSGQQVIISMR